MNRVTYKTASEIEKIRRAGKVVSEVLAAMRDAATPGATTESLDRIAFEMIRAAGGKPSFMGHRLGELVYHHSTCISPNEGVVHGIPGTSIILKEGDILSLDVGVKLDGFHADSALTVPVGEISEEARRLLRVTREALWKGIDAIRYRGRLQDIGRAVQQHAESHGFSVVRELFGHGIGRQLWEPPSIYNFVSEEQQDYPLLEGMTLAIEPMINAGRPEVAHLEDGWTVVTEDGSLSAHFEHTLAITRRGVDVLTLGPHDSGNGG